MPEKVQISIVSEQLLYLSNVKFHVHVVVFIFISCGHVPRIANNPKRMVNRSLHQVKTCRPAEGDIVVVGESMLRFVRTAMEARSCLGFI